MAIYDLMTQSQLSSLLASDGFDPAVRQSIIRHLIDDKLFPDPGSKVAVQDNNKPLNSNTQVLVVTSPSDYVATDGKLDVIVDAGAYLTVTGSNPVFVAAGPGAHLIDMAGTTGNDTVIVQGGSNGHHEGDHDHDNQRSGKGHHDDDHDHDNQRSGNGNFDTVTGGNDIWQSGKGDHDGGHGSGNLWGDSGNYPTLWGGGGDDADRGNGGTVTIMAGSGNDSLVGGSENDKFILSEQGNDTINGGGGHNTVEFDHSFANAKIDIAGGVTTVEFKDRTVTMTNVQELVFTDHHDVKIS
jgi:Ca2+-binding RTX toxin-like protein